MISSLLFYDYDEFMIFFIQAVLYCINGSYNGQTFLEFCGFAQCFYSHKKCTQMG